MHCHTKLHELHREKDSTAMSKFDKIDHPAHYTQGGIEPIDYIEANDLNFCEGNVVKYVTRYRHKNGVEDLKKAKWYLERLIARAGPKDRAGNPINHSKPTE